MHVVLRPIFLAVTTVLLSGCTLGLDFEDPVAQSDAPVDQTGDADGIDPSDTPDMPNSDADMAMDADVNIVCEPTCDETAAQTCVAGACECATGYFNLGMPYVAGSGDNPLNCQQITALQPTLQIRPTMDMSPVNDVIDVAIATTAPGDKQMIFVLESNRLTVIRETGPVPHNLMPPVGDDAELLVLDHHDGDKRYVIVGTSRGPDTVVLRFEVTDTPPAPMMPPTPPAPPVVRTITNERFEGLLPMVDVATGYILSTSGTPLWTLHAIVPQDAAECPPFMPVTPGYERRHEGDSCIFTRESLSIAYAAQRWDENRYLLHVYASRHGYEPFSASETAPLQLGAPNPPTDDSNPALQWPTPDQSGYFAAEPSEDGTSNPGMLIFQATPETWSVMQLPAAIQATDVTTIREFATGEHTAEGVVGDVAHMHAEGLLFVATDASTRVVDVNGGQGLTQPMANVPFLDNRGMSPPFEKLAAHGQVLAGWSRDAADQIQLFQYSR